MLQETISSLREIEEYLRGSRPHMEVGDALRLVRECEGNVLGMKETVRRNKGAPEVTRNAWPNDALRHIRFARSLIAVKEHSAAAHSIQAAIEVMEKAS